MTWLSATTWSLNVRASPSVSESGEPKSTTHGSNPRSCRTPTAPWPLVTSNTLAGVIIGGTSMMGGRDGSFALSGKYRRNRYMSHRSTVWKGDGRDPVWRPPNRSTSTPFCKVATIRFAEPAIKLLPHVIDTTRRTDTPGDHAWVDVTHSTLRAATVRQRRAKISDALE